MMNDTRSWHEASTLAGKLLAARDFLDKHPEPSDTVRTDMREIVREACEGPPVFCALVGLAVLREYERATGRRAVPSCDGKPELAALRAVIDAIEAKLGATDGLNGTTHTTLH